MNQNTTTATGAGNTTAAQFRITYCDHPTYDPVEHVATFVADARFSEDQVAAMFNVRHSACVLKVERDQMHEGSVAQELNHRGEVLAVWLIVGNSAVNPHRWCILGTGETEAQAWADSGYSKRKRGIRAEHVSWEHYNRIQGAA